MIWVYHICFNFILISDHKDVLSTVLYATESLCLMIHVFIWRKNKSRDYKRIYKVWYINFIIVIIYSFVRYIMLYLKYSTVNFMIHSSPAIREIVYKFIARELLDKEMVLIDYTYITRNYIAPLLLLTIGVLTRNSFKQKEEKSTIKPINVSKDSEFEKDNLVLGEIKEVEQEDDSE